MIPKLPWTPVCPQSTPNNPQGLSLFVPIKNDTSTGHICFKTQASYSEDHRPSVHLAGASFILLGVPKWILKRSMSKSLKSRNRSWDGSRDVVRLIYDPFWPGATVHLTHGISLASHCILGTQINVWSSTTGEWSLSKGKSRGKPFYHQGGFCSLHDIRNSSNIHTWK